MKLLCRRRLTTFLAAFLMIVASISWSQEAESKVTQSSNAQSANANVNGGSDGDEQETGKESEFSVELLPGQVGWQAEFLESKFGISTVPEVSTNVLALYTDDGRLLPLVENSRGRAFRKDERLRGVPMEILARVYHKQPFIQILRVYQIIDGQRFEVDYWCDVCAIVMYETGPCSCCQDHNRLRRSPFDSAVE
jgi:hypothetical protein